MPLRGLSLVGTLVSTSVAAYDAYLRDPTVGRREIMASACTGTSASLAPSECAIWTEFYDATGGPNWTFFADNRLDPCACRNNKASGWRGVECDNARQHITALALSSNGLVGSIPAALIKLTSLDHLRLDYNNITGMVPDLPFAQYKSCNLYKNHFGCPLPPGSNTCNGSSTAVTCHYTCTNSSANLAQPECDAWVELFDSTGGPAWTNCRGNRFDPCGCEYGSWSGVVCDDPGTTLLKLKISPNGLVGTIPNTIVQLTNLQKLWLGNNQVQGTIPEKLTQLSVLDTLDLSSNQITGTMPAAIGKMQALAYLSLYGNKLTGQLPDLPFAQYSNGCYLLGPSASSRTNHFLCPLPANVGQCKGNLANIPLTCYLGCYDDTDGKHGHLSDLPIEFCSNGRESAQAPYFFGHCKADLSLPVGAQARGQWQAGAAVMTPEACAIQCAGYAHFGVSFGNNCMCGDKLNASKAQETDCAIRCTGDATRTCGGMQRTAIYAFANSSGLATKAPDGGVSDATSVKTVDEQFYVGCYLDQAIDNITRDLATFWCSGTQGNGKTSNNN